jgi:hypothetical protein
MLDTSITSVIERNRVWRGRFETEPWEAAWAKEALFFIRALDVAGVADAALARVQISPDGMRWCDEGATVSLPTAVDELSFGRVTHFGGWLRLTGELPPGVELKVICYLVLK